MSISPERRLPSISITKTPRPPISLRDAFVRSPEVRMVRTSNVASGFVEDSAARAISVWRSASWLPRGPTIRVRSDTMSAASRKRAVALRVREIEEVFESFHVEAFVRAVLEAGRSEEHTSELQSRENL